MWSGGVERWLSTAYTLAFRWSLCQKTVVRSVPTRWEVHLVLPIEKQNGTLSMQKIQWQVVQKAVEIGLFLQHFRGKRSSLNLAIEGLGVVLWKIWGALAGGSTRPATGNATWEERICCHKGEAMTLAQLSSPWPHDRKPLISCWCFLISLLPSRDHTAVQGHIWGIHPLWCQAGSLDVCCMWQNFSVWCVFHAVLFRMGRGWELV